MKEFTIARTIRGLLVFQVVIGLALVAGDLNLSLRGLPLGAPNAPTLDEPVRQGDQRRRYDPDTAPVLPGNPSQRQMAPSGGDLPSRLTLRHEGDTLLLTGAVAPDDAKRFAEFLNNAKSLPRKVEIASHGGSVSDALAIGRMVREAGLSTFVGDGSVCLSACPYMLAGGVERQVSRSARVGVHQHYFGESTMLPAFLAVEDVQRGQGLVMAFLAEMGIDPLLMQHALTTPPDEVYILLPEEMDRYGLRTGG